MTIRSALAREVPASVPPTVTTRCLTTLPALERELADGLLAAWKQLVDEDRLASCFQSPAWCLSWYRAYHDEFDPLVLVVRSGPALVGLVPLAVRRATGEIAFASGTMADYRDIVAAEGFRAAVVDELLRVFVAGRFPNPLQVGWIDPASDTPALIARACTARGLRFASWQQPCYRWVPVEGENLNRKFSRIRTHLNHFKKHGDVSFDVITEPGDWTAFREAFFQQHTLRQLQADRPVSFDDPRKRSFYERLFGSPLARTHVTALRLDGALLAGHIGFVWRNVLMLGAPSISLEHEQRSPALILLAWVMQNAATLGLSGFDLTVGDTEFKKRLGNQCVPVTMLEVYANRRAYYARELRTEAVALAKGIVAGVSGKHAWKTRILPARAAVARRITLAREQGIGAALMNGGRQTAATEAETRIVELTGDSLDSLETGAADLGWQLHENRPEDLLLKRAPSPRTDRAIRDLARAYARQRAGGATLLTLVAGHQLAAWALCRMEGDTARVAALHVTMGLKDRGGEGALLAAIGRRAASAGAARMIVGA